MNSDEYRPVSEEDLYGSVFQDRVELTKKEAVRIFVDSGPSKSLDDEFTKYLKELQYHAKKFLMDE